MLSLQPVPVASRSRGRGPSPSLSGLFSGSLAFPVRPGKVHFQKSPPGLNPHLRPPSLGRQHKNKSSRGPEPGREAPRRPGSPPPRHLLTPGAAPASPSHTGICIVTRFLSPAPQEVRCMYITGKCWSKERGTNTASLDFQQEE